MTEASKSQTDSINEDIIETLKKAEKEKGSEYHKFGLEFNPFPPAGIPRHSSLPPLDEKAQTKVIEFIRSTYHLDETNEIGEYAGLTIAGDFGMGKTHLMQYIKYLIEDLNRRSENEKLDFSSIVCFIDRPEETPQMIIHRILDQIGFSTIRKFIWMIIVEELTKNGPEDFSKSYTSYQQTIYGQSDWAGLLNEPIKSNPNKFLIEFKKVGGDIKKLQESARAVIKKEIIMDDVLANRYLNLLFPEKETDTSWEVLAGYVASRDLKRKEVQFLNSLVKILRKNDYNMLYVFIDEFEDVSKIKSSTQFSDYVLVLNTLINSERRWAVIVSLTEDALLKIKEYSPPLYDRLTTLKISLKPLDDSAAKILISHYLNVSRDNKATDFSPFSEDLIKEMVKESRGNYRSFIRMCYRVLEYAKVHNLSPPIGHEILIQTGVE